MTIKPTVFKSIGIISLFFLSVNVVCAHVVVKPSMVETGVFQTFSVGVPVEKDNPTIGLRLVIPEGLQYVTPNVKPGWTILKKSGDTITEISWTGGSIPVGERDDFLFSAKVPTSSTTLAWKAYQTYKDGSIVAWDHDPATSKDTGAEPYSITTLASSSLSQNLAQSSDTSSTAFIFSIVAFIFSIIALGIARRSTRFTSSTQ